MAKRKMTDTQIKNAIERFNGNVSAAARFLGVSRRGIYKRIKKNPELETFLEETRENTIDNLEQELFAQALNGNTTALIFALKTQAFHRGYGDRSKLEINGSLETEKDRKKAAIDDAEYIQSVIDELQKLEANSTDDEKPEPSDEPDSTDTEQE